MKMRSVSIGDTIEFTIPVDKEKPTAKTINRFLSNLPCSLGVKYGYFKDDRHIVDIKI